MISCGFAVCHVSVIIYAAQIQTQQVTSRTSFRLASALSFSAWVALFSASLARSSSSLAAFCSSVSGAISSVDSEKSVWSVLEAWYDARASFLNRLPQSLQTSDLACSPSTAGILGAPSSSLSSSSWDAAAGLVACACSSSRGLSWFSSSQVRAPCTVWSCQYIGVFVSMRLRAGVGDSMSGYVHPPVFLTASSARAFSKPISSSSSRSDCAMLLVCLVLVIDMPWMTTYVLTSSCGGVAGSSCQEQWCGGSIVLELLGQVAQMTQSGSESVDVGFFSASAEI